MNSINDYPIREKDTSHQSASNEVDTLKVPRLIARHIVDEEDTLIKIAVKYYGIGTRPYWMLIYEANQEVIGGNPHQLKAGLTIGIPELPDNLRR